MPEEPPMPPSPTLRTLAAAALIALATGTAAWAQEGGEAATVDPGAAVAVPEAAGAAAEGVAAAPAAAADPAAAGGEGAGGEAAALPGGALPVIGQPVPHGVNWQPPGTDLARDTRALNTMVNWIMLGVVLLVTGLLAAVILRFNQRANPTPARFTHNSPIEVTWTVVPIVILVFIGAFSLPILFQQVRIPEGDVHIKVTGFQWGWHYEYVDEGIAFDSFMIGYGSPQMTDAPDDPIRAQLAAAGFGPEHYLLATDTQVVVPVGQTVVVTVTANDVLHSWAVPAFAVKQDAVPGRLAQAWFRVDEPGIFFGQCSELCGKDHAFMPITVRAVSPEDFEAWVIRAREEFPA
jgi:cytochrome c oxidase subunit 2